jgi:hypothetical protein
MRALALVAAVLHLTVIAAAAFLMWFAATFPFENQSPEDAAADDWLLGAAPLIVSLAIAFAGAIAFAVAIVARRLALLVAVGALASELVVDAVVLRYALGKSDHSDGKLLFAALAGVVTGLIAVIAARRARNSVALRPSHDDESLSAPVFGNDA